MNKQIADLLEQHFETAFAAPDGIKKLRELILTLAMQGKLVQQDANDPPASELLREIEAEKRRLVKAGKIKQSKPLPSIKPEDAPYKLPPMWEWVKLGDICSYIQRGKGPKYVEASTHRVISQKCVRWYGLDLEPARCIDPTSLEKYEPIRFLRVGDLLWNSTGTGTIGRACLVPQKLKGVEIVVDSHVTVVRPIEVKPVFLWRWIQSPTVQNEIEDSASGTTNQIELNTSTVINHLMPLPPLPEQHRIVARIDQLMARCDELEKLRKEREEKRLDVHAAAIRGLLEAKNDSAWDFMQQHFGELYTVKENVAELRKAILQLAVMGRLVPQDPSDPPASELLKEIEAEKQRLVKADKIKKPKPLPPIKPEEEPYQLPHGWEYSYLQDLCSLITDGTHQTPKYTETGRPFISAQCVKPFQFMPEKCRYVSEDHYRGYIKNRKPEFRDILLSRVGAGIGEAAIIDFDIEFAIYVSTGLLKPFQKQILPEYLVVWLNSPIGREHSRNNTLGVGASQGNLNLTFIRQFHVSLPPLPEQHRIVARIDQLMTLCDTLDQQIDAATNKQSELLDAVMAQV